MDDRRQDPEYQGLSQRIDKMEDGPRKNHLRHLLDAPIASLVGDSLAPSGIIANIIERLNRHDRRLEDMEDIRAADAALRDGEPSIPYERVRRELGLAPPVMPTSPVVTAENPPHDWGEIPVGG